MYALIEPEHPHTPPLLADSTLSRLSAPTQSPMTLRLPARLPNAQLDPSSLESAAKLLRAGKLVAFATETVYGLGANALDAEAVAKIFEAKGRPRFNPLIVHVPNLEAAKALTSHWSQEAERLASHFWPGPLSLILPRASHVPDIVSAGLNTVALRIPAAESALALLNQAKIPVAAPSANPYTAVSPSTAEHVFQGLGGRIDAVLDDGPTQVGIESTVVDLTQKTPLLLRPGGVLLEALEACLGRPVEVVNASLDSGARPSPGMSRRHYSPDARVILASAEELEGLLHSLDSQERVGGIFRHAPAPKDSRVAAWECLGDEAAGFAQGLYAALFRLQKAGATVVFLETVPDHGLWRGIGDRIRRAAAG